MAEARVERRLAAILAADVAGYSRLMGVDEEGTLGALKAYRRELVDPKIAEHRGRIVKTTGDGVLVEFASAVDAVRCAMEVQRDMAERNAAIPEDRRIEFRIGINVGDIIIDEGDIYGDGVNIAARLEPLATPGSICLSDNAYQQIKGKLAVDVSDMGERPLKNITQPVRTYSIRVNGAATARSALKLPDKPSIAVLPFQNMSGDPEQDYFADGIVEDIITALSRLRWLFVIARNSSFAYKGKIVDVRQIARELGVRYVLEGSVRRGGDRLRITAQLIDAATGKHIWAQRYDREVADIFALQDEITSNVVASIEPQLYAAEDIRAKHKPPESFDAWDCVARALSLMNKPTKHDNAAAQQLLRKAIALDPSYAQAYSLLAYSMSLGVIMGWQPSEGVLAPAWDVAQKAVHLDVDDPWAHLALGHLHRQRRQFQDAIAEFQNALTLNPNFAFAHTHLGYALAYPGRTEEALVEFDTAERLSPRDIQAGTNNVGRAVACFIGGRYRDGIGFARKAIRENPNYVAAHRLLVANSALVGEVEEARAALQTLKRLVPDLSLKSLESVVYVRDEDRRRYFEAFRLVGLE
jgi:adenylate cyclase